LFEASAGKQRKRYPYNQMMTPYEKLKSLPNASCYLKTSTSFKQLDKIANKINDNEAADRLQKAKNQLFQPFSSTITSAKKQGRW
jgi:predicted metalloenzyme YecM